MQRSWSRLHFHLQQKNTRTHTVATTKSPKRQQIQSTAAATVGSVNIHTYTNGHMCKGIQMNVDVAFVVDLWLHLIDFHRPMLYSALQWRILTQNTKPIRFRSKHWLYAFTWFVFGIRYNWFFVVPLPPRTIRGLTWLGWAYLGFSCLCFKSDLSFGRSKGSKPIPTHVTLFQCYLVI